MSQAKKSVDALPMTESCHPLARRSVQRLVPPPPVSAYRPGLTERLYTNPFGGEFRTYPSPCPDALQSQYACFLDTDLQKRGQDSAIRPEQILFTAGSVAGVELLIRAFCEPDQDAIAIQSPVLQIFAHHAQIENVRVMDLPLQGEAKDRLDVDGIIASNAKLTFVVRPSNPVGTVPPFEQLEALAQRVRGLLVVDEAYIEFCDLRSAAGMLSPNVVVLRTFSKAFGLAGVRAGVVIAHPQVIQALRVVADPFAFDTPAQRAVSVALSQPQLMRESVDAIRHERERLSAALSRLPGVKVFRSVTNFLLIQTAIACVVPPTDAMVMGCGMQVPNGMRIAIGTEEENQRALALVQSLVQSSPQA